MDAVYHRIQRESMPCAINRADARQMVKDGEVLVKLNDTERTVGYGSLPIGLYAQRYVWFKSRLRTLNGAVNF